MSESLRRARKVGLFFRSLWKNLILKRKFKSYWLYLTDNEYKRDIDYLYEITKHKRDWKRAVVPFGQLVPSHKVVYPEYVATIPKGSDWPVLNVTKDGPGYRIIDGNHRFEAMKAWTDPNQLIPVNELV